LDSGTVDIFYLTHVSAYRLVSVCVPLVENRMSKVTNFSAKWHGCYWSDNIVWKRRGTKWTLRCQIVIYPKSPTQTNEAIHLLSSDWAIYLQAVFG